jgi:hypothetical protein
MIHQDLQQDSERNYTNQEDDVGKDELQNLPCITSITKKILCETEKFSPEIINNYFAGSI